MVAKVVKKFQSFMLAGSSLPCLQEDDSGPYHEGVNPVHVLHTTPLKPIFVLSNLHDNKARNFERLDQVSFHRNDIRMRKQKFPS
jgi:hypothetical protein